MAKKTTEDKDYQGTVAESLEQIGIQVLEADKKLKEVHVTPDGLVFNSLAVAQKRNKTIITVKRKTNNDE